MWVLKWVKLFLDFKDKDLAQIEMFCQEKYVKKWEIIFNEKDEANAMYILAEWVVEVSKEINSKKHILGTVEAEEILGEMAMYEEKGKRTATATASIDTRLITILIFSIKQLEKKYPEFIDKIKKIILERKIENKNILWKINN